MKSEHRHELKTHELARLTEKVAPFFEKYGFRILMGVCAVGVVSAAVLFWMRSTQAERTAGWTEFYSASSAEEYLRIADTEEHAGKSVGLWARLRAAEQYLQTGVRLSLQAREGEQGSVSDLDEAREQFERVVQSAAPGSELRERALYGLATTLETLAGVDEASEQSSDELLGEAVEAYKRLINEYPDTVYNRKEFPGDEKGRIERRIEQLSSKPTREFYAWFRTQKPQTPDRTQPFDFLPEGHPSLDGGESTTAPPPLDQDEPPPPALPEDPETPAGNGN